MSYNALMVNGEDVHVQAGNLALEHCIEGFAQNPFPENTVEWFGYEMGMKAYENSLAVNLNQPTFIYLH